MLTALRARIGFASVAAVGCVLAGCATAPAQYASEGARDAYSVAATGAQVTYSAASTGAHAVYSTGSDVYSGVGAAAKQPFRDLNLMQDPIPPVLLRAERQPYDTVGLDACEVILDKVAELDLALGPDIDSPKDRRKDKAAQTAGLAASAALDAASSAAEGFLPMRSVIKRVSGASRYEDHVKHAVLAGTVRRSFLKAIGMQHNCGWPAAPLGFQPQAVAVTTTPLSLPATGRPPIQYASMAGSRPATSPFLFRSGVAAGVAPSAPAVQATRHPVAAGAAPSFREPSTRTGASGPGASAPATSAPASSILVGQASAAPLAPPSAQAASPQGVGQPTIAADPAPAPPPAPALASSPGAGIGAPWNAFAGSPGR